MKGSKMAIEGDLYNILKHHLEIDGLSGVWRLTTNQIYQPEYIDRDKATVLLYGMIIEDIKKYIDKEIKK